MTEQDLYQDYTPVYEVLPARISSNRVRAIEIGVIPTGWIAVYPAGRGDPYSTLFEVLDEAGVGISSLQKIS